MSCDECYQTRMLYRPLLQVGVEEIDGKTWSKCLCGWLEPHGSTRCGNAAHQGNVQHAFEDKIATLSWQLDAFREALTDYVPHPFSNSPMNFGTRAMIDLARKAFMTLDIDKAPVNDSSSNRKEPK